MKIVNINDIEDLIINKYFIEQKLLENNKIESKMSIDEFINTYAKIDLIYKLQDFNIPFGFRKINGEDYLFVITDDNNILDIIKNKLKLLKYNLDNLQKVNYVDLLKNEHLRDEEYIIKDSDYYKVI